MITLLDEDTIQRWEYETEILQAEMKVAAEKDAIVLANSPDFSAGLRDEVDKLNLDHFREQGDLGLRTKLVVEHLALGGMLHDLLEKHNLLDMDADYLSDAAEAYVTAFFNVLWLCLAEFENRRKKAK